jgi:hypothetical protein
MAAQPAAATLITIGGIDVESKYTAGSGILTFGPTPGTVTTSTGGVSLIGADVSFQAQLSATDSDGLPFDPVTGNVRKAVFESAPGFDLLFMSGSTVLLALELNFIEVAVAAHSGSPAGSPNGKIVMGSFSPSEVGNPSQISHLRVVGGTLNVTYGGIGSEAVLELLMSSMDPAMTKALRNGGYLNLNFTNGQGGGGASTTFNLTLDFVPEPGTVLLFGTGLIGLLAVARRNERAS